MKYHVLKALLGKYICKSRLVEYCHIDRVIVVEGKKAIVTAIIKTLDDHIFHWFLETSWLTDKYGVHQIKEYKILKEDELNEFTKKDKAL